MVAPTRRPHCITCISAPCGGRDDRCTARPDDRQRSPDHRQSRGRNSHDPPDGGGITRGHRRGKSMGRSGEGGHEDSTAAGGTQEHPSPRAGLMRPPWWMMGGDEAHRQDNGGSSGLHRDGGDAPVMCARVLPQTCLSPSAAHCSFPLIPGQIQPMHARALRPPCGYPVGVRCSFFPHPFPRQGPPHGGRRCVRGACMIAVIARAGATTPRLTRFSVDRLTGTAWYGRVPRLRRMRGVIVPHK